jgi:hypothetical protein
MPANHHQQKESVDMTRMRRLGLCCIAVLALCATVTASASAALPEFLPSPMPFTAKSGATTLETVSKAKITCISDTATGEVTGPKTGTVTIKLSGCELVTLGLACNTVGAPPGEITTVSLLMTLGYINGPKKEVGLDLSTATGGPLLEFVCGPLKVIVEGSAIGKVTPVNKLIKPPGHFTLKFAQSTGKQKPTHFESGPIDVLSTSFGGPFLESGLASTDTLAFPAPLMIAA